MNESSDCAHKKRKYDNKKKLCRYSLHSYICSSLSTEDREKNLYPDLVPTARDLDEEDDGDDEEEEEVQVSHSQVRYFSEMYEPKKKKLKKGKKKKR